MGCKGKHLCHFFLYNLYACMINKHATLSKLAPNMYPHIRAFKPNIVLVPLMKCKRPMKLPKWNVFITGCNVFLPNYLVCQAWVLFKQENIPDCRTRYLQTMYMLIFLYSQCNYIIFNFLIASETRDPWNHFLPLSV